MNFLHIAPRAELRHKLFAKPIFRHYSWLYELKNFLFYFAAQVTSRFTRGLTPSKLYPITIQWFTRAKLTPDASYEPIYPANTIKISPTCIHTPELKQFLPTEATVFEAFVVKIPQGRVVGSSIITPDNGLLEDLSPEFDCRLPTIGNPHNHKVMRQMKLSSPTWIPGQVAVLAIPYGGNYFHWLYDMLPRFYLLQQSSVVVDSIDKFVINEVRKSFQRTILEDLKIPSSKFIEVPHIRSHRFHIQAEQLIVPSITTALLNPFGCIDPWIFDFLRGEFASSVGTAELSGPKYIYISRNKASKRRVLNEDAVLNHVSKYGFQKVYPEEYSLSEQIALFRGARAVISPHGAGLANLVFCYPGTKVIEFCSPKYLTRNYRDIAHFAQLDYYIFAGRNIPQAPIKAMDFDIDVDISTLDSTVLQAGIKPL